MRDDFAATPTRGRLIPLTLDDADPRLTLDGTALVDASRNRFPVVATTKRKGDSGGLIAGGAIALLLGGVTFWSMSGHRAPAPIVPPASSPQIEGRRSLVFPPSAVTQVAPHGLLLPSAPLPGTAPQAKPAPITAPAMVFDGSAPIATSAPQAVAPGTTTATAAAKPGGAASGSDDDQFAARMGKDEVETASAQTMADPAQTVTQGTLIPAVLETAIDTDLPGYVRAVVSRDVRSFDGSRVLIPRSTRLIGQYKSGLKSGQTRAYVIWSRLIRPDGVSVALASPAVDFAGRSGLDGKVDGHFMKRFGSAVLLSVVSGLSALGSASVVLSGGGQSAATVAAQSDSQVSPTIRVPQGQPIRIFTARDLDFSTVATEGPTAAAATP